MRRVLLLPLLLLLVACSTNFNEDHYFKSIGEAEEAPTNYFRIRVKGHAKLSSARYIAGYYDERAVDLFFDEMKSSTSQSDSKIEPLLQGGEITLASGEKLAPLSPKPENGAFVMIFSTNAKAVANTIGQFSESQVAADAITNLANRDQVKESARATAAHQMAQQRVRAVAAEIEGLVNAFPATTPGKDATTQAALRLLGAIAQAKGRFGSFQNIDEARAWFQAEQSKEGER